MPTLRVGIYGTNGHQITAHLAKHPRARITAIAAMRPDQLPDALKGDATIKHHDSLAALLTDANVDLVSLCSPRRDQQAGHSIAALEAGKHVYAEKPCALTNADLDRILATAARTGRRFHEMAGTAFDFQPWLAMRRVVESGVLGTIVQVLAQKSYPMATWRPQDEGIDGGITRQAMIHAIRFVEHVAMLRITSITCTETRLGNPRISEPNSNLRVATCMTATLANGGVASILGNYLNPPGFPRWGNETVRFFGTQGTLEATDGGANTRLFVGKEDRGPINTSEPARDYFDYLADSLLDNKPMPMSLDEELHPTRVVNDAKLHATLAH